MRLSEQAAGLIGGPVARFGYDRAGQAAGIVHLGIGAFHRAHQAWYTDRAMDHGDRDWAITGVSLRSPDVADQLNPQNGLYTVTERSASGLSTRLIGAIRGVVIAPHAPDKAVDALADPATRIVSLTVTEKGYCRKADGGLDFEAAAQGSIFVLLAAAFRRRCDDKLPGLTLLSCDNLAENGRHLGGLMAEYLHRMAPGLLPWFEAECACPSTMVDRIVPATTDRDRSELEAQTGLSDHAAVVTEPFSQWVIEDRFAGPRPRWETVGAQLVTDVHSYETAKLRMLNGAHSLLAYCGLARGHVYVHEAIGDPHLRALVTQLMLDEAAPSIDPGPGQDLPRYADQLLARFANPALDHRLAQIAIDGSQKLPQRWLQTLAENERRGIGCPAICAGITAWIDHLRGANGPVDDPLAAELACAAGADDPLAALFGPDGVLPSQWSHRCPG